MLRRWHKNADDVGTSDTCGTDSKQCINVAADIIIDNELSGDLLHWRHKKVSKLYVFFHS